MGDGRWEMREGAVETHDLILTHPQTHYRLTTDRQRQRQALEARNWFFFFFFFNKIFEIGR